MGDIMLVNIWIVWWMTDPWDSPEICVFSDEQEAQTCLNNHKGTFKSGSNKYRVYCESMGGVFL